MGSFSIALGPGFTGHSVDRWRNDPDLKGATAYATVGPDYRPGTKLFLRAAPVGEMLVSAAVASSALHYETIPTCPETAGSRYFYVFMPNKPRSVTIEDERFVQQASECVLADSAVRIVSEYREAHSGVCLTIPSAQLLRHMPLANDMDCLRLGSNRVASRLISRLLLAVWDSADAGRCAAESAGTVDVLLNLIACHYGRNAGRARRDSEKQKLCCEQVKELIGAQLRDPTLSVKTVAGRVGVTTRYLQLLFAEDGECASGYIRRERLRACLLDLRQADFYRQSISEIAYSWGFNSAAHFSSVFRKEFGLSPSDYRYCDLDELADALGDDVEAPFVQALQLLSRPVSGARTVLAA